MNEDYRPSTPDTKEWVECTYCGGEYKEGTEYKGACSKACYNYDLM